MSPGHTVALVERAACYMKIGKNDLALADAEESLKENRDYAKVNNISKLITNNQKTIYNLI